MFYDSFTYVRTYVRAYKCTAYSQAFHCSFRPTRFSFEAQPWVDVDVPAARWAAERA